MIILEDTRQQEAKHKMKHDYFRSVGVHWNRTALYSGDYTLPSNQSICVDTKKNIQELIGDIQVERMSKTLIKQEVWNICEKYHISFSIADEIYHAICDNDDNRFAEKDINDVCFSNDISERAISAFQALYVKRHGFFHRGLKRAQNSGIRLYILVENMDEVHNIEELFLWENPRLNILMNSKEIIGTWRNGKPKYKRVQKYPYAASGKWLAMSCLTMEKKYGCKFEFCRPEEAGKKILDLLEVHIDEE